MMLGRNKITYLRHEKNIEIYISTKIPLRRSDVNCFGLQISVPEEQYFGKKDALKCVLELRQVCYLLHLA